MIVRMAIANNGLCPEGSSELELSAFHERLLTLWRDVGTLAVPIELHALPQRFQVKWQKALQQQRVYSAGMSSAISLASRAEDLLALTNELDLGCISAEQARRLNVLNDGQYAAVLPNGLEVCIASYCDLSTAVRKARQLANAPIEAHQKTAAVWQERFASLVTSCRRTIVVVDRYCISDHFRRGLHHSGLTTLIRNTAGASSRPVTIEILTSRNNLAVEHVVTEAKKRIATVIQTESRIRVVLFLVDDSVFKRLQHDRYVRVDETVCDLGFGLDVLAGDVVEKTCTFGLRSITEVTRGTEAKLRAAGARINVRV